MKIKLLKSTVIGGNSYQLGAELVVINEIARNLIAEGKAIIGDFETFGEKIAFNKKKQDFDNVLINILSLPVQKILKEIPQITDLEVLKGIVNDKRTKVREAALARINNLK